MNWRHLADLEAIGLLAFLYVSIGYWLITRK
jgi:hypothetical protein